MRSHSSGYPPKQRVSWLFAWVVLAGWLVMTVCLLPDQVNGAAYLAGAGASGTFTPTSYGQVCGRSGCSTVTNGTLSGGASATWPGRAPLGQPFTVRETVWNWGRADLVGSTGNAVGMVIVSVFLDVVAFFAVLAGVVMVRAMLRHRRQAAQPASAA